MTSNPNYKVLASAQITITDQTDAANLAGSMTVVNSSKAQTYLNGASAPYVPNWKTNHLVLRPNMMATSIVSEGKNPDLFDPWLYPDLSNPSYITNIKWYLIDQAGNRKELDILDSNNNETGTDSTLFGHAWEYSREGGIKKRITDARQLVVKDNFLDRNEAVTFAMQFAFVDPNTNISIPCIYDIDVNCIASGGGATRAVLSALNGTSFYNDDPQFLSLLCEYYKDGVRQELQDMIESGKSSTAVRWAVRDGSATGGWRILNPGEGTSGSEQLYEICRIKDDQSGFEPLPSENNARGGVALKVYRGLIAGSDVVRATIEDGDLSGQQSNAMEVLYDYSDPTRIYIDSSNGDKLIAGGDGKDKTALKAVVTYEGTLLEDGAAEYDTTFDYYWYKVDSDGNTMYNMYIDDSDGLIKFINVDEPDYETLGFPKKGARSMKVERKDIDKKATFMIDLLDKKASTRLATREYTLANLVSEDQFEKARTINVKNGLTHDDMSSIYETAYELKAYETTKQDKLVKEFVDSMENNKDKE